MKLLISLTSFTNYSLNEAKELYYKIDCYFSEHIDSYDELKESVKSGTQKVIERGKNGWERFKDNEGKEIKEKASQWIDKYFPEDY